MRAVVTLVRKDLANFFRNRSAVSLTFLIPIALIYIFGWVFGLNDKDSGPAGIRLAVVNASDNPGGQKLVDALKAESSFRVVTTFTNPDKSTRPLTEADLGPLIHDGVFRFAVVIPGDLVRTERIGLHLKIYSDPRNEIEAQMVNGLLQKTIFSNVPELLGQSLQARAKQYLGSGRLDQFNSTLANTIANSFGGDPTRIQQRIASGSFGLDTLGTGKPDDGKPTTAKSGVQDFFSQLIQIDHEQVVGKDVKSPAATRLVGGWAIMFLLFAVSSSSAAFFDESNTGLFQRLLSAPVTRAQILWARFLYGVLLGLIQLTTLFIAGRILYGVDVFGHFGSLLVVCVFAAGACTSFGMLVAAVAPNAQAANGLSTFVVMVMSATGGAWFPMSFMPEFMQTVGKFTVVYWSMEGFARVLWAGDSFRAVLPVLGVLAGITAGVMAIAIWQLNRKQIFA